MAKTDSVYVHPETGEKVPIPEGSDVERNEDGEIVLWRNPPHTPAGELHPHQVPGYEPKFDRLGTHRRVLAFVTDEVDITASDQNASRFLVEKSALGPRNTVDSITFAMARDTNSPGVPPSMAEGGAVVAKCLKELVKAGLAKEREDGTFEVTDEGLVELRN